MKKKTAKKLIYYVLELIYLAILVGFLFYFKTSYSFDSLYETELFKIVLLTLIALTVFFGAFFNKIVSCLYTLVFGFYLFAQTVYFNAFGQYFRITYALSVLEEVNGVKSSIAEFISFKDFLPFIILLIINILFIVAYFLLQRKAVKFLPTLIYRFAVLVLFFPIKSCYNNYNTLLDEARHQEDSFQLNKTDYYIYDTIPSTTLFVEKFGLIPFAYRDYLSFNEESNYEQYIPEVEEVLESRGEHQDNDMTGIFKGKNVVFIQAESYCHYALDEDLTPMLWKFYTEGINIEGFDTPLLVGSTSDTEIMTNTSIIPASDEYASCYSYIDNYYPTTLASIFNDAGYRTDAYHNCYGEYYNRDLVFPELLRYGTWWDCTDMGKEDALSDLEFGGELAWMNHPFTEPYMLYWITYSGHQPYNLESVGVDMTDVEKIKEKYPDLDDSHVSYYAKNMDLDKCLANYIEVLNWENKLDDTVFVFFGDHVVKGLDVGTDTSTDLFIYCSAIEGFNYEKQSTVLDILPTIANLLDLDYDYQTILGHDIFDPEYDGFRFTLDNYYFTNTYKYAYGKNVTDYNDLLVDDEEVIQKMDDLSNLKWISKVILETDYFKLTNK